MNRKARNIILGLLIALVGVIVSLMDAFKWKTNASIVMNIGCSLIASSLVIILTELLVNKSIINPLDEWKINKIYTTRTERNNECDPNIDKASYCVDAIAFGLSHFRQDYTGKVKTCLKNGVNFRLLTMNPESDYVRIREVEEDAGEGHIEHTIRELIKWADELNQINYRGKIVVKGYDCMTLDFYWRVDDIIFVGPYWYGHQSGNTITFSFEKGGRGFQQFEDYFTSLWENDTITTVLTKNSETGRQRRRK